MPDETAIVSSVVERLRTIREARGISQNGLSKGTGLSRSGIRHMESGNVNPTLFFLLRICSYLGEDLPSLLQQAAADQSPHFPQRKAAPKSR